MIILQIKRKWFDMIVSGEKREEYRDIKPYYSTRFSNWFGILVKKTGEVIRPCYGRQPVEFRNGYKRDSPSFVAMCSIRIGIGKQEWGAEKGKKYFILTIHEIQTPNKGKKKYERIKKYEEMEEKNDGK